MGGGGDDMILNANRIVGSFGVRKLIYIKIITRPWCGVLLWGGSVPAI